MADNMTKLAQLIDPEVMADMISAKIPKKLVVAPFAKVDTTLQGVPGSTITVPSYGYIGDADDVAEGVEVTPAKMSTTTKTAAVKKAMKAVTLTDEAVAGPHTHPNRSTDGPRGACPGRNATDVPPRCAYTPSVPLQATREASTGETVGLEASVVPLRFVTPDDDTIPTPSGPAPTRVSRE